MVAKEIGRMNRCGRCVRWLVALAIALGSVSPSRGGEAPTATGAGAIPARGIERLLAEIRQREAELERRARELDERERSLAALEREADRKLAQVAELSQRIEERLAAVEGQRGERIKRLAKVYAAMPPGRAAALLQALDPDLATALLTQMKQKQSAAVLALMDEKTALRLSRKAARPLADVASAPKEARR